MPPPPSGVSLRGTAFGFFTGDALLLFALTTLLSQSFFLHAQGFSFSVHLFFTALEIGFFLSSLCSFIDTGFVTLDEGTLLLDFDLNRACFARGIGLLDFGGRLAGQRDLLAVGRGCSMAGLKKAQQLLLVAVGQRIRRRRLGHARGFQLIQQGFG